MKKSVIFVSFLVSVGCVSGPKLESKVAYLNGGNYKSSSLVGAVPILETKEKTKEVRDKEHAKRLQKYKVKHRE